MPRVPPHFKVRASARNHEKMKAVYWDDQMLAVWVRLGVEAVERYADRTDDTFLLSEREMMAVTGKSHRKSAAKVIRKLSESSPLSVDFQNGSWSIRFPNFSEKQGFLPKNRVKTGPPSSSSSTSTKRKKEKSKIHANDQASTAAPGPKPHKKKYVVNPPPREPNDSDFMIDLD